MMDRNSDKLSAGSRAFGRKLASLARALSTWPFAEPKMAVLYATSAGIILSTGMNFLFNLFKDDRVQPWGLTHLAGLLFILASVMITIVTWSMQFFDDHLKQRAKESASLREKSEQFDKWGGHSWTRRAAFMALILLIGAIWVLFLAMGRSRRTNYIVGDWF